MWLRNVNFPKVKQTKEAMSNVVLTMTNILLSQKLGYFLVCDIFYNDCHKTFIEIDLSAYHNIKYFDWPGFWGFLS